MRTVPELLARRQLAPLLREWRRGAAPLVVLPSTATTLRFAERLSRVMPVAVIGSPRLLAGWAPSLAVPAQSPFQLWRALKEHGRLPHAVISYPDQLVGFDPSFQAVSVAGRRHVFSIVEMMLLMKFRPPAYLGKVRFRGHGEKAGSTLALQRLPGEVPAGLPKEAFDRWLLRLMAPVIDCAERPHDGWLARHVFRLKVDDNFETMLKVRSLEVEALLRMGDGLAQDAPVPPYRELRAELETARRRSLLPAEHR